MRPWVPSRPFLSLPSSGPPLPAQARPTGCREDPCPGRCVAVHILSLAKPHTAYLSWAIKSCCSLKRKKENLSLLLISGGGHQFPSPTVPVLHNTKKYFFSFVLNLLSSNFSVLILCDRQLSDFLPALFLNLNHPNKSPLTPPLQP